MSGRSHTYRAFTRIIVAMLALAVLAAGCGASKTIDIGQDDNGTQIELKTGQELVVTLDANPTTGYSWDVDTLSETVLQPVGEPEFEIDSNLVGAGGVQIMRFKAVEAGESVLSLIYHRPWEKEVEPIETFSIQIIVTQ